VQRWSGLLAGEPLAQQVKLAWPISACRRAATSGWLALPG